MATAHRQRRCHMDERLGLNGDPRPSPSSQSIWFSFCNASPPSFSTHSLIAGPDRIMSFTPSGSAPTLQPIRLYGSGTTVISGGTRLGGRSHIPRKPIPTVTHPPTMMQPIARARAPLADANAAYHSAPPLSQPQAIAGLPPRPDAAIRLEQAAPLPITAGKESADDSKEQGEGRSQARSLTQADDTIAHTPRKRKTADTSSTSPPAPSSSSTPQLNLDIPSSQSDTKILAPIPILPVPLPSKRFKKSTSSKAVLIPVELLPVYPLPPLPPIRDAALAKQVFIHSSSFPRSRSRFEDTPGRPTEHYEKLEHVGDSVLGMVVTTWLHEIKPGLSCGTASVGLSGMGYG